MDDPSRPPDKAGRADLIGVTVIAALMSIFVCGYWFGVVASEPEPGQADSGELISSMYDPPTSAIEEALAKGDGQLFAGQSTDPLVRRPEMVRGGPSEEAYRYQRPLYGWLGWVASGGQPGAVAWGLVVVTAMSATVLVALSGRWILERGGDPRWALVLLAVPGVFIDLTWIGPEALGCALLVAGLARWLPSPVEMAKRTPELGLGRLASPDWVAVALFATAGLARETLLLIPFVLMWAALYRRRLSLAIAMASSAAPYLLWVLFLRVRIGAWPEGSVDGRLSAVPFGGLFEQAASWGPADVFFGGAIIAAAIAAVVLGRETGLRHLVIAQLLFLATLGAPVWARFPDFGRVLLPLCVLSLLAVAGRPGRGDLDGERDETVAIGQSEHEMSGPAPRVGADPAT